MCHRLVETMEQESRISRRKVLELGLPALGGVAFFPKVGLAAEKSRATKAETDPGLLWLGRRKKIERAWLDLLGDFPTEIPALRPVMKKVAQEDGITRYHVSFQAESDDRVWHLGMHQARARPLPLERLVSARGGRAAARGGHCAR